MKETMTVDDLRGIAHLLRICPGGWKRQAHDADRLDTLASHIQAQADEVERLEYRLATANAFGEQCMSDVGTALKRAEHAKAELARVRVLSNAWRNRSIRQSVERLRDAGDTYEWATAKAEASAIEFEDEFTRALLPSHTDTGES